MNIKIIGSGSIWTSYNSASYVIDNNILIDIPNGTCKNILKLGINLEDIENVLLTHFHGDHYFDIPFYLLLKSKKDKPNINIYCNNEGKKKIKKLLKLAFPNSVKSVNKNINLKYIYDDAFKIGDYKVTKLLVEHGKMTSYGYIFENKTNKVGFTGDSALCPNIKYMASICDYLFCDCTLKIGNKKHMGIDNIEELANDNPNCKFILSHLDDDTRDMLKTSKIKNIIVPEDGDTITTKLSKN